MKCRDANITKVAPLVPASLGWGGSHTPSEQTGV